MAEKRRSFSGAWKTDEILEYSEEKGTAQKAMKITLEMMEKGKILEGPCGPSESGGLKEVDRTNAWRKY